MVDRSDRASGRSRRSRRPNWGLDMPPLLNRRSFVTAAAATLSLSRPGQAKIEQAFDIAASASPIRNFRIASGQAPSDLPGVILAGPPKAGLILYEFFDYACSYCRIAAQEIDTLFGPTAGVRLGLVQHPVLSPQSADAARVVLATAPDSWRRRRLSAACWHFRDAGTNKRRKGSRGRRGAGTERQALAEEAAREDIAAILDAQSQRARACRFRQTPSFVLGDFAFVGWPGAESDEAFIEAMRRCGGLRCPSPK